MLADPPPFAARSSVALCEGLFEAPSSARSEGACSRITWALVPLMPNDETPARRGSPVSGHATDSVRSSTAPADQSTCEDGSSTWRVCGSTPSRIAMTILMTPATPAAAWVWPMFDFNEPSNSGRSPRRFWPYVASSACASMGSPSVVPVPCASTASTSSVERPAFASAWRMTRCCEGPLGAVRPLLAPSWFAADPRTTASTRWPLRRASDRRSRSSMPTPSPQPVPSAASANALQRPFAASPRCLLKSMNVAGVVITVTPPASAKAHSPDRSDCIARCRATSDDEHAVSTVTAGPSRPSVYATRPVTTLLAVPVPRKPSTPSGTAPRLAAWLWYITPANTPVRLPRSDSGSIPPRSMASQAASRRSRCCGSIASASRGEILNSSASKSPAPCRNPPSCVYDVLGRRISGS
ncbi:hypothetical protein EES42_42585 [Streptomyces sp. ADI95-17]|nr:hypothetical protein EES42_42585 [Streptomyces sp. ADI95-17]